MQLHANDYDAYENGELRFAFSEDSDASLSSLFAIHAHSGLMVSQYSLQPKDLELVSPSAIKQTHTLKIKVRLTSLHLDHYQWLKGSARGNQRCLS